MYEEQTAPLIVFIFYDMEKSASVERRTPVSYTHLTLPTIDDV